MSDIDIAVLCFFGALFTLQLMGLMWLCMRLDQLREKIEEVLRWM